MSDTVVNVPLDAVARNLVSSLVYQHWTECFDTLKAAKNATWESAGKFCPKAEWPLHQAVMLKNAQAAFDTATAVKEQACKFSPMIHGH